MNRRNASRAAFAATLGAAWAGALPTAWRLGAAGAAATTAAHAAAAGDDAVAARLREGGVVIAFRHALAPGTLDPANFRLGDCSTQRNLSDEGRAQARRMGAWLRERALVPARVRSSPWCRCVDTAELMFPAGAAGTAGAPKVERWAALGSPRGATETTNRESLAALRAAVADAARRPQAGFGVWVTHMFVLADLAGENTSSGEGLLLAAPGAGATKPRVLGRLLVT